MIFVAYCIDGTLDIQRAMSAFHCPTLVVHGSAQVQVQCIRMRTTLCADQNGMFQY